MSLGSEARQPHQEDVPSSTRKTYEYLLRADGSQSLSHLFAQGSTSTLLLARNEGRFTAVKRTLHYLTWYSWWRVMRWIRAKHLKANWTWLRRRYFGKDRISQAGVTLYRPDSVPVTRYRYRGSKIPTPWDAATATD